MTPMKIKTMGIAALLGLFLPSSLFASDLSDGISEYTEEPITTEEKLGDKDTNINFIIVDAIAKAKMAEKEAMEKKKNKAIEENENGKKNNATISNIKDGNQDNNQNSVVIESGSKVDKIYNIVIEK